MGQTSAESWGDVKAASHDLKTRIETYRAEANNVTSEKRELFSKLQWWLLSVRTAAKCSSRHLCSHEACRE
jgi:hypothetical protein